MPDETKSYTDEELYNMMKGLPDFRSFPIPVSWFKKFNIPPLEVINPREFIKSEYTVKCALEEKDLPPLIIKEPTRDAEGNIKLATLLPAEEVKVETITRPFETKDGDFPITLPSLAELPIPEEDLKAMEQKRIARHEAWRSTLTNEQRERDTMLGKKIFDNLNNPDYVAPESEED